MTNQEAIDIIKVAIAEVEWNYPMDYAAAFEMAIEALEKKIPKKPTKGYGDTIDSYCPACGKFVGWSDEMCTDQDKYCECGQALDWDDDSTSTENSKNC